MSPPTLLFCGVFSCLLIYVTNLLVYKIKGLRLPQKNEMGRIEPRLVVGDKVKGIINDQRSGLAWGLRGIYSGKCEIVVADHKSVARSLPRFGSGADNARRRAGKRWGFGSLEGEQEGSLYSE